MIEKQHGAKCHRARHGHEIADDAAAAVGAAAAGGEAGLGGEAEFILLEIGLLGDQPDVSAQGTLAE
jgi:hypothetical protein